MYKKLTKNFVGKNISLFIFLSIAITLCLFGFLFSDSLSKNFLNQIKNDAQKNLG
jgi:NADH:ubiquinone oxidoreductase subunit 3 (subunit A)